MGHLVGNECVYVYVYCCFVGGVVSHEQLRST